MTEELGIKLVGKEWYLRMKETIHSPEFDALGKFLSFERKKHSVFPVNENVFKAFLLTPFNDVRVIILGQDPYSTDKCATGLAFANPKEQKNPQPSLRKILEEVEDDVYEGLDLYSMTDLTLTKWSEQGVLLLNTSLTVRKGEPNSHADKWKFFTDSVIKTLSRDHSALVFMLWGNSAKAYKRIIDASKHHILEAGHPATACYGNNTFSGCKHFSQANKILEDLNGKESKIEW